MAERIAPGIVRLDLGFRAPLGATAYLVEDDDLTLVDAGMPINATRVRTAIGGAGYAIGAIDRVLITHYDLDHIGGLARLTPDLDAPVYLGRRDLDLLGGGYDPPILHHKGLFHRAVRAVYRPPASLSYRALVNGERIGGFEAFHTPGHNPGHMAYVHEGLDAAFLGDLVWGEDGGLTIPVWFDSYDMDEVRESVRRFAAESPPFGAACVAHGEPVLEGGYEMLRALADGVDGESGSLLR
jgi:glyoxylase-like metal-dependent hydrolase (beta-lactamase superfamily II)